jgi:hypothetical protein
MSAYTGPASPSAHSPAPSQSTGGWPVSRGRSGTADKISASVMSTNGRLTAKIQRQDAASTICPPASGPTTVAIPDHAVQEPIAPPRSAGGNVATMTASALGVSSAPNRPCSARPATSTPIVGASAQRSDVAPKPATPRAKIRRSP